MESSTREDVVEQVRAAVDIADLIGSYVTLRPAGRNLKACCPFHKEKTPSFVVSPERQLFHCFGCGAGGDVFTFVMKQEGLEFPEALELLARRAGIELPERRRAEGPDRNALLAAMRAAVRFYRGKLRASEGEGARRYLQSRGFPGAIVDRFYAGFAPGGGDAFLRFAQRDFSREVLVQAGLVGRSEGGRLYDRFRARVVLPILSVTGDPIGFGARTLQAEVQPKYLNSPETPIYKKSRVLFGLPQARGAIREAGEALVVEGYFDVLALASAGIDHAVAPCGTAWTAEHARLLLRQTQRILLLFDGDAAGEAAAWRALAATLPLHPDLGVVMLPEGQDPDDLIRGGEIDRLRERIARPLSPVAFALLTLGRQGLDGHMLLARVAELLASVGNGIAREMMLDEAAERSRMPVRILRREVERLRSGAAGRRPTSGTDGGSDAAERRRARLAPLEEAMLRLALAQPASAQPLQEAAGGVPAVSGSVQAVLAWLADRSRAGSAPQTPELLRRLRDEIGEQIDASFLVDEDLPVPDERFREALLRRLAEGALEAEMVGLGYEIRMQEGQGAAASELVELLARKQKLAKQLAQLRETRPEDAG
ncbi:MAG: DNA primase [Candidatus Eisenbacteria bacterium]|nr:DNA primase [Candidatus Eisenbacteria bacterium]